MNIALARSRFYHLLSTLTLYGLTKDALPLVQAVDELAKYLPAEFDASDAGAEHQTLFGINVYSFESIFLDASGMLGGTVTEQVMADFASLGYKPSGSAAAVDHLGEELGLLAFLCGAEADAREDGAGAIERQIQRHLRTFMEAHLLRWLWPCALAVQHEADPFYAAVLELAVEFMSSHYAELVADNPIQTDFSLPDPPDLLADEKTGLKDICDYLATPIHSGLFLSRTAMVRFGREQKLPSGFGNRRQTLQNLFNSAAQYEGVNTLLSQFDTLCVEDESMLRKWAKAETAASSFIAPWQSQLARTRRMIETMKNAEV